MFVLDLSNGYINADSILHCEEGKQNSSHNISRFLITIVWSLMNKNSKMDKKSVRRNQFKFQTYMLLLSYCSYSNLDCILQVREY